MIAEGVFAGSWECGWVVALDVTEDGAWKLTVQDDAPWWVVNDLRLMGVPL